MAMPRETQPGEEALYVHEEEQGLRRRWLRSSMTDAVRALLHQPALPLGDVLKSIYLSLAHSYRSTVEEIEDVCGKAIDSICIVGGGSKDAYLNRLTAKITGRRVITGLTEATATGNLISQIMADKNLSLAEGRELIRQSFPFKEESHETI